LTKGLVANFIVTDWEDKVDYGMGFGNWCRIFIGITEPKSYPDLCTTLKPII
jgi:hypothetical protein